MIKAEICSRFRALGFFLHFTWKKLFGSNCINLIGNDFSRLKWCGNLTLLLAPHSMTFHTYAPHSSHILIHVTVFHSNTWEANLSVLLLEDIVSKKLLFVSSC
ncbi:hypothetical protein P8452_47034 [Trifolium repens]|nr:hypothetical protein P8452_47034 [Trifolium repens]